ncbi:hypothetical protein Mcup_0536 [Metallosphaera cuprina Ar-4]|uniref:Uncharacterized protein n=1 Tax=Metallosphaera cuprina (strain Ar-4) TaxID=1006006 RepID=F4G0M4_METCR|nr:hypothetical protein Mcup_0536 [Metallosphaera cuprina Ar-4]
MRSPVNQEDKEGEAPFRGFYAVLGSEPKVRDPFSKLD